MFTEHLNCATHVHSTPELCHSCSSLSLQGSKSFLRSWQLLSCTRNVRYLRNRQDHYHVQNTTTFVTVVSQMNPIHLSSCLLRSILILSSHLGQALPSDLFLSFVPTNTLYFLRLRMHPPPPLVSSYLIGHLSKGTTQSSPFFCHFRQLRPSVSLSTPLSNTLNLFSSLNVRDQVSHPQQTTGKITALAIAITITLSLHN